MLPISVLIVQLGELLLLFLLKKKSDGYELLHLLVIWVGVFLSPFRRIAFLDTLFLFGRGVFFFSIYNTELPLSV